jgi:transposase
VLMKKKEVPMDKPGRRQYDAEFKASALKMILQQGRSVADVSRSLGVHESLLHKWKSAEVEGPVKPDSVEVDKLLRYIKQLEMEREILKKALSIFSRTT